MFTQKVNFHPPVDVGLPVAECKIKQWRTCFSGMRKEGRSKLEKAWKVMESKWCNLDFFSSVMHVLEM